MLVSSALKNFENQIPNKELLKTIQEFIANKEFSLLRHGDKIALNQYLSVVFIDSVTGIEPINVMESHRVYYDLHYTISGCDGVDFEPVKNCHDIKEPYQSDGDYILYNQQTFQNLIICEGEFCLIPPDIAHMALKGDGSAITKLVFKIPVNSELQTQ